MAKKNKKNKKKNKTFERAQSGSQYQIKLLLLFLWRGIKNGYKFKLGTEIEAAEKFDDLVFYYKLANDDERFRVRYLQAKCSLHDTAVLTYDDFISDHYKARCNLKKYFTSFRKIKQRVIGGDIQDFIISTNIALPQLMFKKSDDEILEFEEITETDPFFTSSDEFMEKSKWQRYKLVETTAIINPELKKIFGNSTNLALLAEEIAYIIYKPKNDKDEDDVKANTKKKDQNTKTAEKINMDMKSFWLSHYRIAILNDNVIAKESFITFNQKNLKKELEENLKKEESKIALPGNIEITLNKFYDLFKKELKTFTKLTETELLSLRLDKQLINIFIIDKHYDKIEELLKVLAKLIQDDSEKGIKEYLKDNRVEEIVNAVVNENKFGYDKKDAENLCILLLKRLKKKKTMPEAVTLENIFDKEMEHYGEQVKDKETVVKELVSATLNFTLTDGKTKLLDCFLKNYIIVKEIFCIKHHSVFSNFFLEAKNLNTNLSLFRTHLVQNCGEHLFQRLKGVNINATKEFMSLLHSKEDTSDKTSVNLFAEKLAEKLFFKTELTDDILWQQNLKLLKAVLIVSSDTTVKFTDKFLKNELKNDVPVSTFREAFLTTLAEKDLRNSNFDFGQSQAEKIENALTETELMENLFRKFITTCRNSEDYEKPIKNKTKYKNFIPKRAYFLIDDVFDKVPDQENTYSFQRSFFEENLNETQSEFKTILKDQILEAEKENCKNDQIYQLIKNVFNDLKECHFKIHSVEPEFDKKGMITFADDFYNKICKKTNQSFMYEKSLYENDSVIKIVEDIFDHVFNIHDHKVRLADNLLENQLISENTQQIKTALTDYITKSECEKLKNIQFEGIKESSTDLKADTETTIKEFIKELLNLQKANKSNILKFGQKFSFTTEFHNTVFKKQKDRVQLKIFDDKCNNNEIPPPVKLFEEELKRSVLEDALERLKHVSLDITNLPSCCDNEGMDRLAKNICKNINSNENSKIIKFTKEEYGKDGSAELLTYLSESVFVFGGEKNLIKFKNSFFENKKLSKGAELFKEKLKEKFKKEVEFQELKYYRIEVSNYPLCFDEYDIHEFVDELCETIKQNERQRIYKRIEHTKGIIEAFAEDVFVCTGKIEHQKNDEGERVFTVPPFQYIKFSKRFLDPNQKLSNGASLFKNILQNKLEDKFVNLRSYEIKIIDYPFCCENMIENGEIEDDITEFCKKFLLSITPSGDDLINIVKDEMAPEINLMNSDFAVNTMYREVMDWVKKIEDKFLDEREADDILENIKGGIASLMLAGCNSVYCKRLKNFNFTFENNMNILERFFEDKINGFEEKQILQIKTDETLLTSIKVYQTLINLNSLNNFKRDDRFIMSPLSDLLCMPEHVLKAFRTKGQNDLLVIIDDNTTAPSEEFFKSICEILPKDKKKNIIFISKDDSLMVLKFKKSMETVLNIKDSKYDNFAIFYTSICDSFDDKTTFFDLSMQTQEKTLNSELEFQENDIYFYQLLYANPKIPSYPYFLEHEVLKLKARTENANNELITSNILVRLIIGPKIKIGEAVKPFKNYDSDCYIPRKINLIEIRQDQFFDESMGLEDHVFVIEKSENLITFFKNNQINCDTDTCQIGTLIYVEKPGTYYKTIVDPSPQRTFVFSEPTKDEEEFEKICKTYSSQTIHWLKFIKNQLVIFCSCDPCARAYDLKFCAARIYESNIFIEEPKLINYIIEDKIVLIADSAGMGKSTILTSYERSLQKINKDNLNATWIVRIDLNSYTDVLLDIKQNINPSQDSLKLNFANMGDKNDYGKVILTSLFQNEDNHTELTFENAVFQSFFDNSRMLIIFDGFDEISPDYEDIISNLMTALKHQTENKIWVASRPNFRSTLEKRLNVFANELKRFSPEEQMDFLIKFWTKKWNRYSNELQKERMKKYADELIDNFRAKIGESYRDLIGIPLQTKMLAEIFYKNNDDESDKKWDGCFDYIFDSKSMPDFGSKINNLFALYSNLVETKITDYFVREKEIANLSKTYAPKLKELIFFYETELHRILSFVALKEKYEFKDFLTDEETNKMNKYIKEFKDGTENVGIIDNIFDDGQILFNHLTYAEYFAACFLKEKLNTSSFVVFEIIDHILYRDVPVFLYCIKYLLLQQNANASLTTTNLETLNYAAKNGFLNIIKHFATYESFLKSIESDKSLLYYAVKHDQTKITIFLLLYVYQLFHRNKKSDHFYLFTECFLERNSVSPLNDSYNLLKEIKSDENGCLKPKMFNDKNFLTEYRNILIKLKFDEILTGNIYSGIVLNDFFTYSSFTFIKIFIQNVDSAVLKTWIINFTDRFRYMSDNFFDTICGKQGNDDGGKEKIDVFSCLVERFKNDETLKFVYYHILKAALQEECFPVFKNYFDVDKLDDKDVFDFLKTACEVNNLELLKLILPKCAKLKLPKYRFSYTPLAYALIRNSSLSIIKYIFQTIQPDINHCKPFLIVALKSKCLLPTIKYLIEKSDLNEVKKMECVFETQDPDIIEYFKNDHGIAYNESSATDDDMHERIFEELQNAIIKNDEKLFNEKITSISRPNFTRRSLKINKKDKDGYTLLHLAAKHELIDVVINLLEKGAYYNEASETTNETAETITENDSIKKLLHEIDTIFNAAKKKVFDLFFDILQQINLNVPSIEDKDGKTLMYYAAKSNRWEIVKILYSRGSIYDMFKNMKVKNNYTENLKKIGECFELIYEDKIEEFMQKLNKTDFGMDICDVINICDNRNKSFFEYAKEMNNYNLVLFLLERGAFAHRLSFVGTKYNKLNRLFCSIKLIFQSVNETMYDSKSIINQIELNNCSTFIHKMKYSFFYEIRSSRTLLQWAEGVKDEVIIDWCKKQPQ